MYLRRTDGKYQNITRLIYRATHHLTYSKYTAEQILQLKQGILKYGLDWPKLYLKKSGFTKEQIFAASRRYMRSG